MNYGCQEKYYVVKQYYSNELWLSREILCGKIIRYASNVVLGFEWGDSTTLENFSCLCL